MITKTELYHNKMTGDVLTEDELLQSLRGNILSFDPSDWEFYAIELELHPKLSRILEILVNKDTPNFTSKLMEAVYSYSLIIGHNLKHLDELIDIANTYECYKAAQLRHGQFVWTLTSKNV